MSTSNFFTGQVFEVQVEYSHQPAVAPAPRPQFIERRRFSRLMLAATAALTLNAVHVVARQAEYTAPHVSKAFVAPEPQLLSPQLRARAEAVTRLFRAVPLSDEERSDDPDYGF